MAGTPQQVAVVAVESEKLDTTLSLPAQITPYEVVDIYPKVTGFLDIISVDRGSRVHAGELIIRLSAPNDSHSKRRQRLTCKSLRLDQFRAGKTGFGSRHLSAFGGRSTDSRRRRGQRSSGSRANGSSRQG